MRRALTTLAELAGMACISAGCAAIWWPIGLISAGICLFLIGLAAA